MLPRKLEVANLELQIVKFTTTLITFPRGLLSLILNIQANNDKESVDQAASNLHSSWLLPIQTVFNATTHTAAGAAAVDARQDHQDHRRNDNRTSPEDISLHVLQVWEKKLMKHDLFTNSVIQPLLS